MARGGSNTQSCGSMGRKGSGMKGGGGGRGWAMRAVGWEGGLWGRGRWGRRVRNAPRVQTKGGGTTAPTSPASVSVNALSSSCTTIVLYNTILYDNTIVAYTSPIQHTPQNIGRVARSRDP